MTFEIRWTESAFNKLQKLDLIVQTRILEKLDEAVASDPFLVAKKLTGVNLYSIRDYRVIVSIEKNKMIVFVVIDLGHRSKIYKKL